MIFFCTTEGTEFFFLFVLSSRGASATKDLGYIHFMFPRFFLPSVV